MRDFKDAVLNRAGEDLLTAMAEESPKVYGALILPKTPSLDQVERALAEWCAKDEDRAGYVYTGVIAVLACDDLSRSEAELYLAEIELFRRAHERMERPRAA